MNSEKGQALPLAIMALAIGTLLVAPFLGHASSNVLGSRTYADAIAYRNACDAGVEHAIWSLVYNKLGKLIPNLGDQITYQLPETINGVIPIVTVTSNSTGGSGSATGNITKTVIDSFNFDGTSCNTPDMIRVSDDVYAIAYEGPANDGFLKTVEITPDGTITNSTIDILEFDTSDCSEPSIIHVSGDIYAIAYRGPGSDGFLKTMTIAANGAIGNSVIDTLEFDTSNCYEPDITYVSGIYFAIAYRGQGDDGFLKTVSIAANGDIGNSVIDTLEFDTNNTHEPDIIGITSAVYAIAYQGQGSDGFLKTVSIAANGDIGNSVIDTLEFDTLDCAYPNIINISGNVYAVAYSGSGNDGFLKTMTISAAGDISNSVIDSFEFDPANGEEPQIIYVGKNVYAIVYDGPQNDGYLITLPIESNGDITGTIIDTFEYDKANGNFPDIIPASDGIFAVAYCIPSSRGSLVTIGIATAAGAKGYRIVASAGDTSIQAYVFASNTTASIFSWKIQ
jgi:hypothetical protein